MFFPSQYMYQHTVYLPTQTLHSYFINVVNYFQIYKITVDWIVTKNDTKKIDINVLNHYY
mgnify:CR=1 FL=1